MMHGGNVFAPDQGSTYDCMMTTAHEEETQRLGDLGYFSTMVGLKIKLSRMTHKKTTNGNGGASC
jgi:hypothetical protein